MDFQSSCFEYAINNNKYLTLKIWDKNVHSGTFFTAQTFEPGFNMT